MHRGRWFGHFHGLCYNPCQPRSWLSWTRAVPALTERAHMGFPYKNHTSAHTLKLRFWYCKYVIYWWLSRVCALKGCRFIQPQHCPGWKGTQKIIWSNVSWEREPRWDYLTSCPTPSWKHPVIRPPPCHLEGWYSDYCHCKKNYFIEVKPLLVSFLFAFSLWLLVKTRLLLSLEPFFRYRNMVMRSSFSSPG